ncbi:RNA-binding protein 38 isoform X1 [Pelodiscus sinensis]|uniref:RNA-binding protein 38 isoform X1 n=1 Tax=Pelodiscus sinensis TaxID=13735 RepID=UPI003F6A8F08
MPGPQGFKACADCGKFMPRGDPHDSCLKCLGEAHLAIDCTICKSFKPCTRKERVSRLKLLLMETALQPVPPDQPAVRSALASTCEAAHRHQASASRSRHRSHSPPSKRVKKLRGRSPSKKPTSAEHRIGSSPVRVSPPAHRRHRGGLVSPGRLPSHRPSTPDTFEAAQDLISLTTSPPSSVDSDVSRSPPLEAQRAPSSPLHGPGQHAMVAYASEPLLVGSAPATTTAPFTMPNRHSQGASSHGRSLLSTLPGPRLAVPVPYPHGHVASQESASISVPSSAPASTQWSTLAPGLGTPVPFQSGTASVLQLLATQSAPPGAQTPDDAIGTGHGHPGIASAGVTTDTGPGHPGAAASRVALGIGPRHPGTATPSIATDTEPKHLSAAATGDAASTGPGHPGAATPRDALGTGPRHPGAANVATGTEPQHLGAADSGFANSIGLGYPSAAATDGATGTGPRHPSATADCFALNRICRTGSGSTGVAIINGPYGAGHGSPGAADGTSSPYSCGQT